MTYSRIKLIPFAAILAIIVVDSFTRIFWQLLDVLYRVGLERSLFHAGSSRPFWEFTSTFLVTLVVIAIARWWEKKPWSAIGISRVSPADLLLGLTGFLLYINYFYIETPILAYWVKTNFSFFATTHIAHQPEWQEIWVPVTAALFEEVATRAYIIEQVVDLSGSLALAGAASLCLSVAIHVPGRTLSQMVEVVPILLFLTILYMWCRNIAPGIITHCLGNAVETLVLFPERWQIMWIFHPNRNWLILAVGAALFLILKFVFEPPSDSRRVCERARTDPA